MSEGRDHEFRDELGKMAQRTHFTDAIADVKSGTPAAGKESPTSRLRRRTLGVRSVADERRLHRAVAVFGLAVLTLVLTGIGIFAHFRVSSSLEEAVAEELRTIRDTEVSAIRYWVENRLEAATRITAEPDVTTAAREIFAIAAATKIDQSALLAPKALAASATLVKRAQEVGFFGAGLIDPTFHLVAAHDPKLVGVALNMANHSQTYLIRILRGGGPAFAQPRLYGTALEGAKVESAYVSFFGTPISDESNRVIGVLLFGEYVGKNLQRIVAEGSVTESGESYAIDATGTMVTTSRFEREVREAWTKVGLALEDPRHGIPVRDPGGDIFKGFKPKDELAALPLSRAAAQSVAAAKASDVSKHQGVIVEPYRDYRGIEVVGAWRWLPDYGFSLVTEIDAVEAFAPLRYLHVTTISVVVAVLLMAMGWGGVTLALRRARKKFHDERLGSYRLIRKVNEGGVGEVYLAEHGQLRRPAAVKVLKESRPTPTEIRRFEDEALQACRLSHPNTVQIYDFGVADDGRFYLAMEYLKGINLAELLAIEGAVKPERAVHIAKQVLYSLREAHGMGLIHRDIKPHNVMLCRVGGSFDFVKVLDFGLVKSLRKDERAGEGATRHMVGTPLYMAPERLRKGGQVDHRSDLYSVGVLLYVLIAGHGPFASEDDYSLMAEIIANRPRTLRSPGGPLPEALQSLVMRTLAGNPDKRPQSADQMLAELDALDLAWAASAARAWWDARPSLQASLDLGRFSASQFNP